MTTKGVEGLYEYCCDDNFYDWIFQEARTSPPVIYQKHICMGPVYYKEDEILTLIEKDYDSVNEEMSTWKIARFRDGTRHERFPHRPYRLFQLETEDDLLVIKCKIRPVLLIKKIESDWKIPDNYFFNTWLCLPLFSYKSRHSQQYVLSDQKLQIPHRFYFPQGNPGLDEECSGLINELQFIPETNLYSKKCFCDTSEPKMSRPIKLSDKAFQAAVGHIARLFPGITISGDACEWYDFFRELVNEEIDKVISP